MLDSSLPATPGIDEWLTYLSGRSMNDAGSLWLVSAIARALRIAQTPGDVVECGSYKGASAAAMAKGLLPERRLMWLYDSFQGLPEPSARDCGQSKAGEYRAAVDDIHETFRGVGLDSESLKICAGWFQESFSRDSPTDSIALLHVDCDLYDSVLLALRTFYPRVVDGGVILLDDFGWYQGTRLAFYDFAAEVGIAPLVERVGPSQLLWVKGRLHNRDRSSPLSRVLTMATVEIARQWQLPRLGTKPVPPGA